MTSPVTPGAGKLTSSVSITIGTPSFYNPPKKFAPVVAPKPKVNPYRGPAGRPETPASPPPSLGSSNRGRLGRVGEAQDTGLGDDLPLPPPPPADDGPLPPPGCIPPPPPPPPFEESFPPPPAEDSFPSPPPPLAEELPAADWPKDAEAPDTASVTLATSSMLEDMQRNDPYKSKVTPSAPTGPDTASVTLATSMDSQIDSLTSMLEDMQSNDPYKSKVTPSAPTINGGHPMPPSQGPGSQTLPQPPVPPATKFGPRAPGLSSAKPLKPQGLGPKPQPGPPPAPWVGQAKPRPGLASVAAGTGPKQPGREPGPEPGQGNTLRPAARPWAARQEPAASPSEGQRHQAALAPAFQHKPTWNRTEQKERPTVPEPPKLEQGSVPSLKAEEPAPFSYKDVEELENLARQFMQEMDSHPKIETLPAETCSRCGKDLARSQAAVKAMGKMFHVECFTCSRCRQELKGQQFYEVDHEPLCESCHSTTLDKCVVCQQPITERLLRATGKTFHPKCFTCVQCKKVLEGQPFIVDNKNQVYCVEDYHRAFAPKCSVCNEPIVPEDGKEEAVRIIALDKNFHVKCYRCEDCERSLSSEADEDGCYPLDGHILCLKCHASRVNEGKRD